MWAGKRVVVMLLVDRKNRGFTGMTRRLMSHHRAVAEVASSGTCVIGRKAQELTGVKGPGVWVLTRDRGWSRNGVRVAHTMRDLRGAPGNTLYVLGGATVFSRFERYADEYLMWTLNNKQGDEDVTEMVPTEWKPIDYTSDGVYAYSRLGRL